MNNIIWPGGADFAISIVDDTDGATIKNVKPIYDYLYAIGLKATKTVWVYPPKDNYAGSSLQDKNYRNFILDLQKKGFEIALHGVGSGGYTREEIREGFKVYKEILGEYPRIHINHSANVDNIYWGVERFVFPLKQVYQLFSKRIFSGHKEQSKYFWGDIHKKYIRFTRNRVFTHYNTLARDPKMPYRDQQRKPYANYFFSSSDAHTVDEFVDLLSKKNIDRLKKERGAMIIYTHFACGFVDEHGELRADVQECLSYLVAQSPASLNTGDFLEFLLKKKLKDKNISYLYLFFQDMRWLVDRCIKKFRYKK